MTGAVFHQWNGATAITIKHLCLSDSELHNCDHRKLTATPLAVRKTPFLQPSCSHQSSGTHVARSLLIRAVLQLESRLW